LKIESGRIKGHINGIELDNQTVVEYILPNRNRNIMISFFQNRFKSLLFILLQCVFALTVFSQSQPNIILIMTDDQGWYDAGFNGNETIITPNLDKLAGKGVIFNRFYSGSAVCSPTRASVLTGRNPNRMGVITANKGHMKEQEITLGIHPMI